MGLWTNNGLILAATAIQTPGATAAIAYVGISLGYGTLASALTGGTPYTQIVVNGTLAGSPSIGQPVTITDGTNTTTCTVNGPTTVAGGQTTIPVISFTPSSSFAANTTAVCPTPQASDTALYGETQRAAVSGASAGGSPGESLNSGYFDGTQPTGVYILVGFFGGSTATSTPGTGILMAEDIVYWSHTLNTDTNMYQADSII